MTPAEVRSTLTRRVNYIKTRMTQHFSDTPSGNDALRMFENELEALEYVLKRMEVDK